MGSRRSQGGCRTGWPQSPDWPQLDWAQNTIVWIFKVKPPGAPNLVALYFLICETDMLTLALANLQGWCGNPARKHRDSFGKYKAPPVGLTGQSTLTQGMRECL